MIDCAVILVIGLLCRWLGGLTQTINHIDYIVGMETVDHFPIVTAILGILISLVCKPTDKAVREQSVTVLTREPGFQFELLDNVINSASSQTSSSPQFADRKQFALRNCEFVFI